MKTLFDQDLFNRVVDEVGGDPVRQTAFLAAMTNVFASSHAAYSLTNETDLARLRLLESQWIKSVPEDKESRRWVESLGHHTTQEMTRVMVRATNRARRVFQGKAPGTGNGF